METVLKGDAAQQCCSGCWQLRIFCVNALQANRETVGIGKGGGCVGGQLQLLFLSFHFTVKVCWVAIRTLCVKKRLELFCSEILSGFCVGAK